MAARKRQRTEETSERAPLNVLLRGENFAVLEKRGGIPCHKDDFVGKLSEIDGGLPLLQLGRNALGESINLVHRLDRGASGCVLVAFSAHESATAELQAALRTARKTYIAITRGTGRMAGENLQDRAWFTIDRPIKDRKGNESAARTGFRFIAATAPVGTALAPTSGLKSGARDSAGAARDTGDEAGGAASIEVGAPSPRASIVLCRPETGRWHQIRRHLNGLSHPILGDSVHGNSKTNREWRAQRDLPSARLCLHLARMEVPATSVTPAIDVSCPLPADIRGMLDKHAPGMLQRSQEMLLQEANLNLYTLQL